MSRQEPFLADLASTDPQDTRRTNRNRILRCLITKGPATRAELARRTGMSRPTVSVIATELLNSGVVTEGDRVSSGGAPGTLLEIAKNTGVIVALDLRDAEDIKLATVSSAGSVISSSRIRAANERAVVTAVDGYVKAMEPGAVIGVAVAVSGFVDPAGSWVENTTNDLDVRVVDDLRRALRLPIYPVNATDACTMADLRDSPEGLSGHMTVVVPAAAAGLVVEGRLLTGAKRPAGDIAHVVTSTSGPVCPECKATCLYAQVRQLSTDDSLRVRRRTAATLASVLAPIVAAVEMEQVVLAGLPDEMAASMSALTEAELSRRLPVVEHLLVRPSTMGEHAALVGAATMLLFRRMG